MVEGINIVEKALKKYNGRDVCINTFHKLYGGKQKIKCKLNYIFDNNRIGFCINEQEIYIDRKRLTNFSVSDDICFADDVMEIRITKQ